MHTETSFLTPFGASSHDILPFVLLFLQYIIMPVPVTFVFSLFFTLFKHSRVSVSSVFLSLPTTGLADVPANWPFVDPPLVLRQQLSECGHSRLKTNFNFVTWWIQNSLFVYDFILFLYLHLLHSSLCLCIESVIRATHFHKWTCTWILPNNDI